MKYGKIKQGRDTPFIIKSDAMKQMVHTAPNIKAGVFSATFNEETEEVENMTTIEGELDARTKDALSRSQSGIVTLS